MASHAYADSHSGYYFGTGDRGLGYYEDKQQAPRRTISIAEAIARILTPHVLMLVRRPREQ